MAFDAADAHRAAHRPANWIPAPKMAACCSGRCAPSRLFGAPSPPVGAAWAFRLPFVPPIPRGLYKVGPLRKLSGAFIRRGGGGELGRLRSPPAITLPSLTAAFRRPRASPGMYPVCQPRPAACGGPAPSRPAAGAAPMPAGGQAPPPTRGPPFGPRRGLFRHRPRSRAAPRPSRPRWSPGVRPGGWFPAPWAKAQRAGLQPPGPCSSCPRGNLTAVRRSSHVQASHLSPPRHRPAAVIQSLGTGSCQLRPVCAGNGRLPRSARLASIARSRRLRASGVFRIRGQISV